ncbi:hypothetical protein BY996DRAFT_6408127 [Phakopsora pachyrhizi]|nr:hypothetical protein BY996DRAFT_6408127 [Phakopsora pachyrhizi]
MDKQVIGVLDELKILPVTALTKGWRPARIMVQEASCLLIPLITLDALGSQASQISNPEVAYAENLGLSHHFGSFNNAESMLQFSRLVDILTVEIEHVDVQALKQLKANSSAGRSKTGLKVHPIPAVIELI